MPINKLIHPNQLHPSIPENSNQNNKRIAKNTAMLFFRMFTIMAVSLYTSRIVLDLLGIADYGVYNIVGGIVALSSFITNSMSNGVLRFITYALGEGNHDKLRKTFGMCINLQLVIAIALFLLLETIGLWFLNTQLNIPQDRMNAANWVYQFSILTILLNITSTPYSAAVIAYEKMSVFAYVSIIEVILKLGLVFLLTASPMDSLQLYAILMFVSSLIIRSIYQLYCRYNIKGCRYYYFWDLNMFKAILSFSGWNMLGGMSIVFGNHGVNILLNIFFGVVVNAAKGVSMQVQAIVFNFHNNILTALRPSIIKAYAQGNYEYMRDLTYRGAKYSFLMLLLVSFPMILETEQILSLWLKEIPKYSALFTRLLLIVSLIDCLSGTIMIVSQATGNLKRYQLTVTTVLILQLPISYIFLKLGFVPESVFYINIVISSIVLFVRIHLVHLLVKEITVIDFLRTTFIPISNVLITGAIIPIGLYLYLDRNVSSSIIIMLSSIFSVLFSTFFLGINTKERNIVKYYVLHLMNHSKNKSKNY